MFFLFYKAKCARLKNRVRFSGFERPSAPDRHRARNFSRFDFASKVQVGNKTALPLITDDIFISP